MFESMRRMENISNDDFSHLTFGAFQLKLFPSTWAPATRRSWNGQPKNGQLQQRPNPQRSFWVCIFNVRWRIWRFYERKCKLLFVFISCLARGWTVSSMVLLPQVRSKKHSIDLHRFNRPLNLVRPKLAGSNGKALQHEFVAEKEKPKPAEPVDTEPMLRTLLSCSQLNVKGC